MLLHKGFIGKIEYDDRSGLLTGEVLNAPDLLEFQGKDALELKENFIKCIEDYCLINQEYHKSNSVPFIGNYNISVPTDKQTRIMRAAKQEGSSMEMWLNRRVNEFLVDYFQDDVA